MYRFVIINGSYTNENKSATFNAINKVKKELCLKYKIKDNEILYYQIPKYFTGCYDCKNPDSENFCSRYNNDEKNIVKHIINCDIVLFATPVYLDTPTGIMINFLHRLTCTSEKSGRKIFNNVKAYTLAVSYCSGTKTVIHTLFGCLEMLGFNIPPRSSRESIYLWKDDKIRGGVRL